MLFRAGLSLQSVGVLMFLLWPGYDSLILCTLCKLSLLLLEKKKKKVHYCSLGLNKITAHKHNILVTACLLFPLCFFLQPLNWKNKTNKQKFWLWYYITNSSVFTCPLKNVGSWLEILQVGLQTKDKSILYNLKYFLHRLIYTVQP